MHGWLETAAKGAGRPAARAASGRRRRREGLRDVGQQVLGRLDPRAQPYEPWRYVVAFPTSTALGCGPDAAEARRLVDEPATGKESLGSLGIGELEADHSAEPPHLSAGKRVSGVAG